MSLESVQVQPADELSVEIWVDEFALGASFHGMEGGGRNR